MKLRAFATAALLMSMLASRAGAGEDEEDRKTRVKMLKDGAKKLGSAKVEEREEGIGYLLGYLSCADRQQYVPVLLKALKDSSPEVREGAAQSLEKVQATEAIPDLIALLEDENADVKTRAAYALGGMGKAAESAVPALKKARDKAGNDMVEGSMENALQEIAGKAANRYKCP
jgi:HEAT repeat protein